MSILPADLKTVVAPAIAGDNYILMLPVDGVTGERCNADVSNAVWIVTEAKDAPNVPGDKLVWNTKFHDGVEEALDDAIDRMPGFFNLPLVLDAKNLTVKTADCTKKPGVEGWLDDHLQCLADALLDKIDEDMETIAPEDLRTDDFDNMEFTEMRDLLMDRLEGPGPEVSH